MNDSIKKKEQKFYLHYFGELPEDIATFYDPLRKRLRNPAFRSISREYLKHLRKSARFTRDLVAYCREGIVFDILQEYPRKLLKKFCEDPRFLEKLDGSKSKFEWTKFEMEAAICHFLHFFNS